MEENGVIDPESTIIYQRSKNLPCSSKDTSIILPPGKTKVYYLPWLAIRSILSSKRYIIRAYVRLMAEKYDYTAVGVNVKIGSIKSGSIEQKKETFSISIKNNIKITQRGISFDLSKAQTISVTYYDLKGKAIPQLSFVKNIPAGNTLIPFEKKSISKGLYIVKIKGIDFEKRINTVFLGK